MALAVKKDLQNATRNNFWDLIEIKERDARRFKEMKIFGAVYFAGNQLPSTHGDGCLNHE